MSVSIAKALTVVTLLAASSTALANADVTPSITAPSGTYVYQTGRYNVSVSNIGNKTANSVTLTIQLPETNTSPTVYVMGTLGAKSTSCAQSGTRLTCALGSINRYTSKSVYFDIALPESADPLVFDVSVTTTSSENSTANNSASSTASLNNYDVSFTGPVTVSNSHCTGTALSAYYECTLFASSISSHSVEFADDGGISFPLYGADYTGAWWQDSADHLAFEYYELGTLIAEFEGWGVSAKCWEGLTTFPGSSYVSPYRVCVP